MCGLSTFCGLHARIYGEDVRVIRGYADELLDRLVQLDGLSEPHLSVQDRIAAQAFDISAYKIAADELVVAGGGELLFHAMAVGLTMREGTAGSEIDTVVIESKSGRGAIRGKVFIDGSGDGDIAYWAGSPMEVSERLLYPSLMFRINGVDALKAGDAWNTVARLMDEAEEAGTHKYSRTQPLVRPQSKTMA